MEADAKIERVKWSGGVDAIGEVDVKIGRVL